MCYVTHCACITVQQKEHLPEVLPEYHNCHKLIIVKFSYSLKDNHRPYSLKRLFMQTCI